MDSLPKDCKNIIFSYLENYERILAPVCKEWNAFFSSRQKELEVQVIKEKGYTAKDKSLIKSTLFDFHAEQMTCVLKDLISLKKLDSFIQMVFKEESLPWRFDETAFFLSLIELNCLDQLKYLYREKNLDITNLNIPGLIIYYGHFQLFKWVIINFSELRYVAVDKYIERYTYRTEIKEWIVKYNDWYNSAEEDDFQDSENENLIRNDQEKINTGEEEQSDEENEKYIQPSKKQKT